MFMQLGFIFYSRLYSRVTHIALPGLTSVNGGLTDIQFNLLIRGQVNPILSAVDNVSWVLLMRDWN